MWQALTAARTGTAQSGSADRARRTLAGHLYRCGGPAVESRGPPRVVQALLGHSQIPMTLGSSSHVLPTVQEEAMERLTRELQEHQNTDKPQVQGSLSRGTERDCWAAAAGTAYGAVSRPGGLSDHQTAPHTGRLVSADRPVRPAPLKVLPRPRGPLPVTQNHCSRIFLASEWVIAWVVVWLARGGMVVMEACLRAS
jgi:hypothetical protein